MENQIVEMTEAEHAQHHIQLEQQLKTFWTKQLAQVRVRCLQVTFTHLCSFSDGTARSR